MRQRIQALDGLRFLAAIGVLWIHTWTAHYNPRCYIGKFDIADILAIGGNGVDLFFVISGFCMYYFYARSSNFSYHDFYRFLVKRWVRLSPAFYVATAIYIAVDMLIYHKNINPVFNMMHSLFYFNDWFGQYNTAEHFWTLTVEWQFYFTIPFLLIYQNRIGFQKIFAFIFGGILLTGIAGICIMKTQSDVFIGDLPYRGIEFGCGTLAARFLINNNSYFKQRILWLFVFIIITYSGRICISNPILSLSTAYYNLYRLAGFTLMSFGFAGILYLSLTSTTWLNKFLSNKLFKSMGRVSYSFYLFHALIFPVVAHFTIEYLKFFTGILAPIVSTCIGAIILYPIALLSYTFLEKPFLSVGNLTTK